jgi:WD40 repeat protein
MYGRIPWGSVGYALAGCIAIIAAAVIPAPYPIQITALKLVSAVAFGGSALLLPLGLGFTKAGVLPFGIVKSGVVLTATAVGLQAPAIIGPPLRAALSDLRPFKQTSCDSHTGVSIDLALRHDSGINSVALSPDGMRRATGSSDNTARLWDVATGQPIGPPLQHDGGVNSVAFSPDGKWLATGSSDNTARLWDVATGQPIGPPLQHNGRVNSVAFSPDGKRLATGGEDGKIKLWPEDGVGEPVVFQQGSAVLSLAVLADGRVVTASADGTARIWAPSREPCP